MRLRVLGSSSAGNCTLVWNGRSAVMVDCGFPPRYILAALRSLDLTLPQITGLLITHVHSDHLNDRSIDALVANRVPVYVRRELSEIMKNMYPSIDRASRSGMLRDLSESGADLGGFEVNAFSVPHDSPGGCFGFSLSHGSGSGRRKTTIATDFGFQKEGLVDSFKDSHAVVIESNHDVAMLENSGRPPWLKKRIREVGHLSNDQCAQFVTEVAHASGEPPRHVVLAHISQQCNTNEIAERTTAEALSREGYSSVRVIQSFKAVPSEIIEVC